MKNIPEKVILRTVLLTVKNRNSLTKGWKLLYLWIFLFVQLFYITFTEKIHHSVAAQGFKYWWGSRGGVHFFGLICIAFLGDLRNWPLLVNQKYWWGSSLTGLTVSAAPVKKYATSQSPGKTKKILKNSDGVLSGRVLSFARTRCIALQYVHM